MSRCPRLNGIKFESSSTVDLIWKSEGSVNVENDKTETLFKLLNTLEENDDVQSVSSNFEVEEDLIERME